MPEILKMPGFVDVHAHFREPSDNKAETIANGSHAAMLGGYVAVADMPNNPGNPTWTVQRLQEKRELASTSSIPIGFYSGSQPEHDNLDQLPEMAELSLGLKLYGAPTTGNSNDYSATDFEKIVRMWHRHAPEKPILFHAGRHNLRGIIHLVANKYEHPLHICHVNNPNDVARIGINKDNGLPLTCGVTPHHLIKTSHDELSEGQLASVQPPLARQDASERLLEQLASGEIDIVESDYAPHLLEKKLDAEHSGGTCYGMPGIEHVALIMIRLVQTGKISRDRLVDAMSTQPSKLLGITSKPNTYTEWLVDRPYLIREDSVLSGAGYSPYVGKLAVGELATVVIGGNVAYRKDPSLKSNVFGGALTRGDAV